MTSWFLPLSLLAGCLLALNGCSGGSAPPPSDDQTTAQAKAQIKSYVETVKTSPKSADADAGLLLESLHALVDQFGAEYQPLVVEAEALQKLQQSKAPAAEIDAQLQKLQAAADQL